MIRRGIIIIINNVIKQFRLHVGLRPALDHGTDRKSVV